MNADDEMPEAYRLGWIPFLGLKIHLDSHPLIPRPETEWWTEQMLLEIVKNKAGFSVLDLCAGSGAIGCAMLRHFPTAQVYFGEIDGAHEATIRKNIRENGLDESRAHIGIGDLFAPFGEMRFDFIAANPPYIPEARELPASVADYEPALALRAGGDGLAVIKRIAEELPRRLRRGGQAWIECDSVHAATACALFTAQGSVAEVRADQYGAPRFIVISFP